MAPALTEILSALGVEDQIVAVGDYVQSPPAIAALPKIGAYDGPNIERIVELEVDLYVTTRSQAATRAHAITSRPPLGSLKRSSRKASVVLGRIGETKAVLGAPQLDITSGTA
jgi:iron complex transport system substrate-binding protein